MIRTFLNRFILLTFIVALSVPWLAAASGATIDINLYGSSSQYFFWNTMAPAFLGNQGCANIKQATFDSKNAITQATCGLNTVNLRVSAKASFDGIYALLGNDSYATAGPTTEKCSAGDYGDPGTALRPYYRKMVDESSCSPWGSPSYPASGGCTSLKCVRVTLAASDVAAVSYTQSSHGNLKGPLGDAWADRVFSPISVPSTFNHYNPIVVPFAFFVNTSVKKCYDAVPTMYNSCTPSNQQTISNLPRMMAVEIFSGQSYYWTDFGGYYVPNVPVVACLRHAGSGAHATLDYAVMDHGGWGALPVSYQRTSNPTVWFNDTSSDEMNCINGNGSWAGTGAIGYANADQLGSSYANTVRLNYDGEAASRENIRNGNYNFCSNEWVYEDTLSPSYAVTHPYIAPMMTFAAKPANIPGAPTPSIWGADKSLYWASSGEMHYNKNSDQKYPGYVGATNPQLP